MAEKRVSKEAPVKAQGASYAGGRELQSNQGYDLGTSRKTSEASMANMG